MRLEHHLVGGYVRYISPHIIIIIIRWWRAVILTSDSGSCDYKSLIRNQSLYAKL